VAAKRKSLIGLGLVVFATALWVHWPSLQGDFLRIDDVEYLRKSMHWNGLTWNAVKWAFTTTESYYQPLTRLSHVLDYQLWGTNAAGHHASSVILHALNAALVFGFLWTLLGTASLTPRERWLMALGVALVFAVHPLQTESVAWMSGRTQLLCTTFMIGALWEYVARRRLWAMWGLYVAALLCKPMAVSLPFVMLAIDYYPLRRQVHAGWPRLFREKAAMIVLAMVAGIATVITKSHDGNANPSAALPLSVHVYRMFESLAFYLWKLVWPTHLSPTYPVPWGLSLGQAPVLASVLIVILISVVAGLERRRWPILIAAWGAYVVLVVPSSGLMSPAAQTLAQRYAYVAMLPPLLLLGGAAVWLVRRSTRVICVALTCLLVGEVCAFAIRTRRLIPSWHNDETLWRATLVEFPDSEEANRALATQLCDEGRASEALPYAQRAVELAPQAWEAHMRLGLVLAMVGRLQEAIVQHEQALQINPNSAMAKFGLAVALDHLGKTAEAIPYYEDALRLNPSLDGAHFNLANALAQSGRLQEAVEHYELALRIQQALQVRVHPDLAATQNNLAIALFRLGRVPEAIEHYQEALRINPDSAEAHNNVGLALFQVGRVAEAIEHYRQALRIKPDFTEAQFNLRNALEAESKAQATATP